METITGIDQITGFLDRLQLLSRNSGLFDLGVESSKEGELKFGEYSVGFFYNDIGGLSDVTPETIFSTNCGACTQVINQHGDIIKLIDDNTTDLYFFQDIEHSELLFKWLKENKFNYLFIPTHKYTSISGMLICSERFKFQEYSIFLNPLCFDHVSEDLNRSSLYPVVGVKINDIWFYSAYLNCFSSPRAREQTIIQLVSEIKESSKYVIAGRMSSYGELVNSRRKWYPLWYEIAFLPQIILSTIFRKNWLNILELKKIEKVLKNRGAKVYLPGQDTYCRGLGLFRVGWQIDYSISNIHYNITSRTDGLPESYNSGIKVTVVDSEK